MFDWILWSNSRTQIFSSAPEITLLKSLALRAAGKQPRVNTAARSDWICFETSFPGG